MDNLSEKKWFVYLGDRHEGPFSLEEIQGKMTEGRVSFESFVWAEGMSDWQVMKDISDFQSLIPISEPSIDSNQTSQANPTLSSEPSINLSAPLEPAHGSLSEEPALSVAEEKTGEMNLNEMRQTQKLASARASTIPSPPTKKSRGSFGRTLKWVVVLTFVSSLGIALKQGFIELNPKTILDVWEKTTEIGRPYLITLSEKLPVLSQWISPIPSLSDVKPEEYEDLKGAAREKSEQSGIQVALALSQSEPLFPTFYVSSNLPDGTQFQIFIVGKSETLLNQLTFGAQVDVVINKKLGKTKSIHYSDGKPVPRGEYTVYVSASESQTPQVKNLLTSSTLAVDSLPGDLPKNTKVLAKRTYFLGGVRDAVYIARLKEYHTKLQLKATNELEEVRQFSLSLESQLVATKSNFSRLKSGKVTFKQRKQWELFHNDWIKFESHLDQNFMSWTPDSIQKEKFYPLLYVLIQQAGQEVEKVHGFHHAFFIGVQDSKTFDIQLGAALSSAESVISLLKSKIDLAKNLQPTLSGMPRRDGI